jgi:hypothetical protein
MSPSFCLLAAHEWQAHDPFGRAKPADVSATGRPILGPSSAVALRAARNGYASFRALVQGQGAYRLTASIEGGLEIDLYQAWYHRMSGDEGQPPTYWPDALIPAAPEQAYHLPDPDNRIPGQKMQAFWIDVYVPADVPPGEAQGRIDLTAGGQTHTLQIRVQVLEAVLPDQPSITIDHNSYGARWLLGMYPKTFAGVRTGMAYWTRSIELLHHYYRLVHEHRGLFHNLGYGHSGAFDPIYGPRAEGRGRDKTLVDWTLYDRHYGPLFDGSAFAAAPPGMPRPRRPAAPLKSAYTPINPDWPADYLWWGERGYEVEFQRVAPRRGRPGPGLELEENRWTSWIAT